MDILSFEKAFDIEKIDFYCEQHFEEDDFEGQGYDLNDISESTTLLD